MNEAEWMTCSDPTALLDFLHGRASDRKLRLFACAGCRRFRHCLDLGHDQAAVDIGEQIADGNAPRVEHADAHVRCYDLDLAEEDAYFPALGTVNIAEVNAAGAMGDGHPASVYRAAEAQERRLLCKLLQDVVSNPFTSTAIRRSWLTWKDGAIPKMAQLIYDDRAFDRLPLLADALEDAGCTDADILAHCRSGGEHVRGCWVVDLLLGKS